MTHGGAWYGLPSENLAPSGTPTWAVGTPDADFPLANSLTLEPDVVAKANENTATYRLTFGAAKQLGFIAFYNLNFPGVTAALTNNAGMTTQNKTVTTPEDDLAINLFFDLTEVLNTNATQWNLAITGTAPVTIGTVVAYEALNEFHMRWEYELLERFPVIEHRTSYQKRLQYRIPVRYRKFQGVPFYASDIAGLRTLRRDAQGSILPWPFVADLNDPDTSLLVQFASDEHSERPVFFDGDPEGVVEHPIALEEVNAGLSLL